MPLQEGTWYPLSFLSSSKRTLSKVDYLTCQMCKNPTCDASQEGSKRHNWVEGSKKHSWVEGSKRYNWVEGSKRHNWVEGSKRHNWVTFF